MAASNREAASPVATAMMLEREGRLDEAIRTYQAVVTQQPTCAEAHHGLAVCHCKKGESQIAASHYQEALRLAPHDPEILCDFAYFHYLSGDLAQAESLLNRAMQQDPGMPRAHANMGLVLARVGKRQEAVGAFVRAGCSEAEAHVNVAYALLWDNQLDPAEKHLKTALQLEPSSPNAAEGLVQLSSRRGLDTATLPAQHILERPTAKNDGAVTAVAAQMPSEEN